MLRHNIPEDVFRNAQSNNVDAKILKALKDINYDETKDFQVPEDKFAPKSKPAEDYIHFPSSISKYEFITTEADVEKLKTLVGVELIGVDAEWKPSSNNFDK